MILKKYFPELTEKKLAQLSQLADLYKEWNDKINVISRKDIDNVIEHHILHSLAIAKAIQFKPGTDVLDLGTGGGLPGIPLAIYFEDSFFTLIDSRKKKAFVTQEVLKALELPNCRALQQRGEEYKEQFDFVVCRAVAPIDKLREWTRHLIKEEGINSVPNGILALKGGNPEKEIKLLPHYEFVDIFDLKDYFDLEFYKEKYLMYVQA
ncbi:MAG: 16S rRNA (guanine527-N7)-methyltransferase [Cognaticolwellia sp.]|jgi:16S rRNA (guanine527-N7)-methyltransferase